ncbi:phage tail sheath subtilisin-like domain-containing protein [Pyxidicoccus xibeiensis]|uniref:phage tail sheath subtilisin-like domain-containing protein n=1 Tax=Pyxidicoccus xibeiensis TaxID=2906759 RepID=UPI0020A79351|nr:phage tail sheath subtilisin-like domain-containing protein [Pyxidicoccus xibeiensis]MCP3143397.1 phage tail sheath subtilisin-like domain-containing protein [Pyxidicoccus xibeiensis]
MRTDRLQQAPRSPAVTFAVRPAAPALSPLRTDVAGIIARTERGPLESGGGAAAVRVEGLRGFERTFGAPTADATGHAVRGYFENGGELLWVARVAGGASVSSTVLDVSRARGVFGSMPVEPSQSRAAARLRVEATSPGLWGNTLTVQLTLRRGGTPSAQPMADLLVSRRGRAVEHLLGLAPQRLVEQVNERSAYVRLSVETELPGSTLPPQRLLVFETTLASGEETAPGAEDYRRAALALVEAPEPALLLAPDAWDDLGEDETQRFYAGWAAQAHATLDRLVLVDPPRAATAQDLLALADLVRTGFPELDARATSAAALYYPWVRVPDPWGSALRPTREVPPSGHVAGLVSRLDRERGAQHTPANAALTGAVALQTEYDDAERAVLHAQGLNALRCSPGRGVEVWGGRTLHPTSERCFVAHRRLVHRLVRAMRRVAEPLIFDSHTPLLRLTFVRALTSVLLEAYRSGGLVGSRPEEAFRVRCDDSTQPADAYDTGHCVAEVELAPATPMEFIHLTIALSQDGSLQVLE